VKLLDRWYFIRAKKKLAIWHRSLGLYAFVFILWGLYRLLFRFPVWIEETFFKAIVFGLPVFVVLYKTKKKPWSFLGMTTKNLFEAVYLGLGLGLLLGFVGQLGNFIRHQGSLVYSDFGLTASNIGAFLILALITAFWEELLFMGYILNHLVITLKSEWQTALITSGLFSMVHLPALVVSQLPTAQIILQLILLITLGIGNSILMLRTKNLAAPILAHALWGTTIFIFR